MIYHIFNSSLISGPETLVMPAIAELNAPTGSLVTVVLLRESRIPDEKQTNVETYIRALKLPLIVIDVHSRFDRQAVNILRQLLEAAGDKLEVVHAHDVKASFYLFMAARGIKVRFFSMVSTHHGVDGRTGLISRCYELFYSYILLPHFDRVLTVCTQDRQTLLKRGLKSELVQVHLNGVTRSNVSAEERSQRRAEIRRSWGLASLADEDVCVIGVAARLEQEKRPFEILEIAQKMVHLNPSLPWIFLFFGRGSLQQALQKRSEELGLQGRVRFMGYRAGLGEEFAGFDVLLSLSRAEGLPINLLEAGWSGTPIFSTAVHGVNDLIPSPDLGMLVGVNESTSVIANKLLGFIQNREDMQQKGRSFQTHVAANFSQEVWLNNLMKFYKELRERKELSRLAKNKAITL